jgi:hypothetical protein
VRRDLQHLALAIESIERHQSKTTRDGAEGTTRRCLSTTWPQVDQVLGGGLICGTLHEWFSFAQSPPVRWVMPLSIFIHLTRRVIQEDATSAKVVVWIGRLAAANWPNPLALISKQDSDRSLLERSLFVDPPDDAARVWAIDLALRSPAVAAVVADGCGLDMAQSRRLQLAAESGGSIGLLARPLHELRHLSAATTRWLVRPAIDLGPRDQEIKRPRDQVAHSVSSSVGLSVSAQSQISNLKSQISNLRFQNSSPRWIVQLLRCKGVRSIPAMPEAQPCWVLESNGAQGTVNQSADVADRSDETAPARPAGSNLAARLSA